MKFPPTDLEGAELALQANVRTFLADRLPPGSFEPGLGMDAARDPAFSKDLADQGWVGMAIPTEYGGAGRGAVDRFVVAEELLRWGAPVGHHWVADRQTGPLILRFGTEDQRQRFLPAITRGELAMCIGMSETEAGSDLAAVSTRATRDGDDWRLTGRKIWTSGAQFADWCVVLARTQGDVADRHVGLSQFLVDLHLPGIQVNTIRFMDGEDRFAELVLDDVPVAGEMLIGAEGDGWAQNTSELAYERGGPDRWLSTYLLVERLVAERPELVRTGPGAELLGRLTAQYWALRRLSLAVARSIDRREAPAGQSALVKEWGTRFEQEVLAAVWGLLGIAPARNSPSLLERLLFRAVLNGPSFTIRGGTTEVLRSVAAKELRS